MSEQANDVASGRANAACAAVLAILNRFADDPQLFALLRLHAESAKANLLNTSASDEALRAFDKAIAGFLAQSKSQ